MATKPVVVPAGADEAFSSGNNLQVPPGADDVFGPEYTAPPPAPKPRRSSLLPSSEPAEPRPPGQQRGGNRTEQPQPYAAPDDGGLAGLGELTSALSSPVPQKRAAGEQRGTLRARGVPEPFVAPDDAAAAASMRYQARPYDPLGGDAGPLTPEVEAQRRREYEAETGTVTPEREARENAAKLGPGLSPTPDRGPAPPPGFSQRAGDAIEEAGFPGVAAAARRAIDTYLLGPEAVGTTLRIGADIANLATLGSVDPVVDWLEATDEAIKGAKSNRYQEQRRQLGMLMMDPEAGVLDVAGFVAKNPGFAAEIGIPSVPSMLVGAAGARLASMGARGAAREAAAVRGATTANVGMNAGGTFSDTEGTTGERLGAAGVAGLGTLAAGGLAGGGAEATLARGTRAALPAAVATTAAREGVQEGLESLSQSVGTSLAEGELDLGQAAKAATMESAIGAGLGGAAGAVSAGRRYEAAAAKGFRVKPPLATDSPDAQRTAVDRILDGAAAMYGVPSKLVARVRAAADRVPLDKLGTFYSRALQGLQARGVIGKPVDPEVLDAMQAGPVDPEAESKAAKTEAETQKPETPAAAGETLTAAEMGLSEPDADALAALDVEAHQAATSPLNEIPEPTDAQKEAGNYRKGHVVVDGFNVSIENPKGSVRRSKADAAEPWQVTMPAHYGYIRGSEGADGDHVDLTIGPRGGNGRYWVINQTHPDSADFDEHKVFTGVDSAEEAVDLYRRSFTGDFADRVFQSVSGTLTAAQLRDALPELANPEPFTGGEQQEVQAQQQPAGDAGQQAQLPAPAPAPAPKPAAPTRQLDPERDTMLQALAKLGGVRREDMAAEFGLRPEELRHSVAVGRLKGYPFRKNGGMQVDSAISALREAGYFDGVPDDQVRAAFEEAVYGEFGGSPRLTSLGEMERGRVESEERGARERVVEDEAAAQAEAEAEAERQAIMAEAGITEAEASTGTVGDWEAAASQVSNAEFMRAMGFTEQEISDATAADGKAQKPAEEAGQPAAGPAPPPGPAGVAAAGDQQQRSDAGRAQADAGRRQEEAPTGPLKEVFAGQFDKGMTEWNARPAARRLAKERPELDWRVEESDDPRYTSARFVVRGYERAQAPKKSPPKAVEPYDGATLAEIMALKDVPTVEIMREAIEAVGEAEFERQAQKRLDENGRPAGNGFPESMVVEGTARNIVALARRNQLLTQPTPADLKAKAERKAKAPELDRKAQIDREVEGFQLQMQTEERRTDTTADLFAAPPPAAPPVDLRGPQDRNGLRAEDRLLGNVRAAGAELSGQIMEEAGLDDFDPKELPGVVRRWAADAKVPADDLREEVVRRLRLDDKFKGRAAAIKALQPTTAPAAPESAAAPAGERDEKGQRQEGRRQEVLTPAAEDAPAAPPAAAAVDTEGQKVALRKRLSVLKSLERCLQS